MSDSYHISGSNFIIYGAGATGRLTARTLLEQGYSVIAFVDAYKTGEIDHIKIISPQAIQTVIQANTVLVVSLNNGLENERVALVVLKQTGLNRILFLPMYCNMSDERKKIIRRMTSNLMNGFFHVEYSIPKIKVYDYKFKVIDDTQENNISFWIDRKFLYVGENNVMSIDRYLNLYRYIETGIPGGVKEYIEIERKQNRRFTSEEELLADRKELYDLFSSELNFGTKFFEDSPIPTRWNDAAKHTETLEGCHRLYFLIYKGFRYIPVCMSYEDFSEFQAEEIGDESRI